MDPRNLAIKDFTYDLPEDRIAKYPLPDRDASKLLTYEQGKITEDIYKNLDRHLPSNSLLVFNDTKVIEARLLFQKLSGGVIEIFCLEPHEQYADITDAMNQHGKVLWQCLIGGASKWKHGQILEKKISSSKEILLHAKYLEKKTDCFIIEFSWNDESLNFAEILHHAGAIPLPPYIKRAAERSDEERYQTIYAHHDGSVAAPTAGLHFTEYVFDKLRSKDIKTVFVTLHVGAGTFKPVKTETIGGHEMHAEFINVSKKTIGNIFQNLSQTIIPVGTTSLRTIESLYWLGVKSAMSNLPTGLRRPKPVATARRHGGQLAQGKMTELSQWECYELEKRNVEPKQALEALIDFMEKENLERLIAKTQILIAPPYKPKIANALITNFHQPQSTLLLLVAALIKEDWRKVYDYALEHDFRFLSYGDGCLLWIRK
jgi:S-adenosylmethionine:tRNA ribosyltransferase-isomerase